MPEIRRSEPPYLQVFQHYQKLITSGDLRDGDRMPSVREIAGEWAISPATAGKVLGALQSEGLVESRVGAGTVVTTKRSAPSGRDRIHRRRRTGSMYHPGERSEILSADVGPADDEIVAALQLEPGSNVISRRRVVYQHDRPVEVSTSYIPASYLEAAPGLARPGN
jgi:DNA-binding GntR family transcriptional regulator